MSVLTWVLLGVFTGVLATFPVKRPVKAIFFDVCFGVLGGCLGGWLFNASTGIEVTTLTLNSALLATLGAVISLTLYHSIAYHPTGSSRR